MSVGRTPGCFFFTWSFLPIKYGFKVFETAGGCFNLRIYSDPLSNYSNPRNLFTMPASPAAFDYEECYAGLLVTADVTEGLGCHGTTSRKTATHLDMICSSFQISPSNPNDLVYMTQNQEWAHIQVLGLERALCRPRAQKHRSIKRTPGGLLSSLDRHIKLLTLSLR